MSIIKDLVKNKKVTFKYYRDGDLWYEIEGNGFTFPVPVKEAGTATFLAEDKAILFMRYVRRHMDMITAV